MSADAAAEVDAAGAEAARSSTDPRAGAHTGRIRWAVNTTQWQPAGESEGAEFQFLLSLINERDDREQVGRFVRFVDKKRALLSRLLVRQASALVLGLGSFQELEIARTKGKKPFLRRPRPAADRPEVANFNFSVSHEGEWVILASEPVCVCGADVAAPQEVRPGSSTAQDIFRDLEDQLTPSEWAVVRAEGHRGVDVGVAHGGSCSSAASGAIDRPEDAAYGAFQRHWCCKEAFVKARGDGLEFPFNRIEFSLGPAAELDAMVQAGRQPSGFGARVDGRDIAARWRFFQQRLGNGHWAAVGRGPTGEVIDANGEFRRTLLRPSEGFSASGWRSELDAEEPPFVEVPVGFLVPSDDLDAFRRAGGSPWEGLAVA